jgi:hypothetical protein
MGSLVPGVIGEELTPEEGRWQSQLQSWRQWQWRRHGREARGLSTCSRKGMRGIKTMPRRGEDDPHKTQGNLDLGDMQGQRCRHLKSFHCQEYYPLLRLSLNLLKSMYSHSIVCHKLAFKTRGNLDCRGHAGRRSQHSKSFYC